MNRTEFQLPFLQVVSYHSVLYVIMILLLVVAGTCGSTGQKNSTCDKGWREIFGDRKDRESVVFMVIE